MNSSKNWLLLFLLVIDLVSSEDPCESAIDISNSKRDPSKANTVEGVELCDSDLDKDKWYFLGGKITDRCVDFNRCSTFAGIWYEGQYPTGNEIVTGRVCAKLDLESCCGWSGTIKIRNCPQGYVYQLATPDDCPMSYCVGKAIPCTLVQVYANKNGICYDIPQLQKPTLGDPYISKFQMFGLFNTTKFSVDCNLNSVSIDDMPNNAQLKVETVFRMNDDEVGRFVLDYPVSKVTLEESKLVGHIGKTLTCEAHLFYEFKDGSKTTNSNSVKSLGYYFGIEATDCNGVVVKEILMKQGVSVALHLQSTFPITYGHCVGSNECHILKYSFKTAATTMDKGVRQDKCQIRFENPHGILIYKSLTPINVAAQITPGNEHSKQFLSFEPFRHMGGKTIFEGFVISPVQINVEETEKQPTCHSVGDPHFSSFTGINFDNYYTGDFNLLSTKHRTFQIQVRQIPCFAGTVTCNCGMIAREGNNLIGISTCDYRKAPVTFQLMKDDVNPTASLKITNNEYHIKFVSGISLKITLFGNPNFLNIYVNALKHEQYEGICSATAAPADFNVYRVAYAKSFFKSQLPPCVNEILTFPECKCVNDQQNEVMCEFSQSQQDTGIKAFENICGVKKRMKKVKRSADDNDEVYLVVESRISKDGFTIDDLFSTVDRSRDKEDLQFKDVELMTSNEAQGHCSRILEKIQFSNKCREFLGDKHEALQKNCIDDVKLTGRANLAQTYLNIYEEVCMTTLAKEVVIVDGETSPESKEIIDVLEEMNSTFNERQLNSWNDSWKSKSTTSTSIEKSDPCPKETVLDRNTGICIVIPLLQNPTLSNPYFSAYKMFGTFNATMFSVDCELSSSSVMTNGNGKLKVEVVFRMNEEEIAKFASDFPVTKVTLEETYLAGHIGKTLTCEAQLYYEFKDGSFSTRTSVAKSSGYYFGIEPIDGNDVVMKKIYLQQGVPEDIYLRSTFPITFGHCIESNDCNLRKYSFAVTTEKVGLRQKDCQIQFENPHGDLIYKSSSSINIAAEITPGKEHSKHFLSLKPLTQQGEKTLFNEYVISPVQVVVSENRTQPSCHSIGDPHFKSFHGKYFDNYFTGDFNLMSTKHRTFQIQVRQIFCTGRVTCNCGMIAREGNNLIGISVCDYRSVPVVFQLMKDNVNPTVSLELIYNEFHIKFASGISIKVSLFRYGKKPTTYLNIYVNGLKHEQYDGICSATASPADFNAFRIPYSESFFKGQLPSCVNEVSTFPDCKCFIDQQNVVSPVCGFFESQQDTEMVIFENICDVKKGMKKETGGIEDEVSLAVESKTSQEGVTLDDIFNTVDRGRDDEDFKEVELMPLKEAQSHCSRTLEKSQFYSRCRELLGDKFKSLQTNCIDDVRLSGTSEAADIYLNIYEEVCKTMLVTNVTIVDGEKSSESNDITEVLAEMETTFIERQLNSSDSWKQESTTDPSGGKYDPCPMETVFDQNTGICSVIPQLQKPILSNPYISAYKMFGTFNATMFSVDCELNSTSSVMASIRGKLKMETVFKMNEQEIAKFVSDFPVTKVTMEETYLVGHIGKTLTCEAQLYYEFKDGSFSTRTSVAKSSGYYFGIEPIDGNEVVIKKIYMQQGVPEDVYLRSTFPITFGHCIGSNGCNLRKYSFAVTTEKVGLRQKDCQIQFENPHGDLIYKSSSSINIAAEITPGKEHSKHFLSFKPLTQQGEKTLFNEYVISPVQVVVSENQTQPTCHSIGDPHFKSFHKKYFDNYFPGDFNLVSTKHRTFQIQVRQIFCAGRVTCNCGMIAREGNNLIGISVCDYRSVPVVFQLMKDNVNPTVSLELIYNEFHIKFASGISIKVSLFRYGKKPTTYLNIYVNGLKHEQYDGICSSTASPADFNAFRIPYSESFFKGQLPSCVNEVSTFPDCKCFIDQQNVVSPVCGFFESQQDTEMVIFENICDVKKGMKKETGGIEDEVSLAVESKTSKEGVTLDDIFNTVDRGRDDEDSKEVELMPLKEAQSHCSRTLEKSLFYSRCRELLGDKFKSLQTNCIDDVRLSGTSEAADIYLNIYEEICKTMLASNVTIIEGEKSSESNDITEVLAEMEITFIERQLNSSESWSQESTTDPSGGKYDPCPMETVFDRNTGICSVISQLQKPILSNPYISAYKMFGTFNATMFSVDCELNSTTSVMASMRGKLKVETVFKMNEEEIAKFVSDFPVTKVTMEETYLVGHIGKTLTCEAQLYYEFKDGSFSTRTSIVKSSGYYFGIEPIDGNEVVMKKIYMQQGVPEDVYLRSTFPITFGHCIGSNDCNLRKYSFAVTTEKVGLRQKDCQIHFENPHGDLIYKSSSSINIAAEITPGKEHSKHFLSFKPLTQQGEKTLFNEYVISPVQVVVSENQTQPTCHSIADPHFKSFHGKYFDNYFPGDFNLVSTKHRTFQIQVRQIFCTGRVTCNCGMIAREGNNLIGISVCDYRSVPVVFQLMKDNVNPSVSLELIYNEFHIKFASGISIKVSLFRYGKKPTSYLNIYVNGLKHEQYDGICSATASPADFNAFRIPYSESFFKGQLPSCVNEVSTFPDCKCFIDQQNVVSAVCGFFESQQDTEMVIFENICDVKKEMKKETGGIEDEVSLTVESKTSKEGVTLDDIFNTVDRGRDDEDFKDVELMSLSEAQSHCSRILEKSQFYNKCRELLGDNSKSLQTNCIDDVRLSGTSEAADIYLNIYEEVCMTTLSKEVTIVDGEKSPESKESTDILAEMNTTFTERLLNSTTSWLQDTKPCSVSALQKFIGKLNSSHVLVFSGTILITGTVVFNILH